MEKIKLIKGIQLNKIPPTLEKGEKYIFNLLKKTEALVNIFEETVSIGNFLPNLGT